MASKASIDAFLAEPAIAVVGVSRSGKGFGILRRASSAGRDTASTRSIPKPT